MIVGETVGRSVDPGLETFVDERERLIAIAVRIVDSRAVAEELVQESWLRWDGQSYPTEKAKPIFRRIVANLARDWYRRQKTEAAILGSLAETYDEHRDAERILIARQDVRKMIAALEELDPRVVKAFRMSRVDGLTLTEIAKRLDTVPSRIHAYVVKALTHVALRMMD